MKTLPDSVEIPSSDAAKAGSVTLKNGADIRPEPVEWLWSGWLSKGKVHVLAGAPGCGKTTVATALAATTTTGGHWPDGTRVDRGDVIIWSGEDDPADILAPRLIACGADMARVHFVTGCTDANGPRAFDPATDAQLLSERIAGLSATPSLLIIDPLVSAVAGDSNQSAVVRRALQPLVDLAQVQRCAVLGISHFSKGTQARDPVDRVTGSLAFGALARVVLGAAKLPDSEGGGRLLVRAKNNLGADSGGFRYHLEPLELPQYPGVHTVQVRWGEALEGTARELLAQAEVQRDPEERTEREEVGAWLRDLLSGGPKRVHEIMKQAREFGHAERTLQRARRDIGALVEREGFGGGCRWSMPIVATYAPHSPHTCQPSESGEYAGYGENGARPKADEGEF